MLISTHFYKMEEMVRDALEMQIRFLRALAPAVSSICIGFSLISQNYVLLLQSKVWTHTWGFIEGASPSLFYCVCITKGKGFIHEEGTKQSSLNCPSVSRMGKQGLVPHQ